MRSIDNHGINHSINRNFVYKAKQMLSPKYFFYFTSNLLPWLLTSAVVCLSIGFVYGFYFSPPDYQQGEGYRIIYVHVPSAFWSLGIYTMAFLSSVIFLVWRIKLADIFASCCAPIGATYTVIALVTGVIWGKPMWGTWWVWDARLTSELILLFLYLGYMGVRAAANNPLQKAKIAGILAVVGMVDVPIVHFSVEWWQTLHQGATLLKFAAPTMPKEMLIPLFIMIVGFGLFFVSLLFIRMRTEILEREYESDWVRQNLSVNSYKENSITEENVYGKS